MSIVTPVVQVDDILDYVRERGGVNAYEIAKRAYNLAVQAHEGQNRKSGEPYISHCVAVARILKSLYADPATITAAFLHDVLEDSSLTVEDVRNAVGDEVTRLVEGMTKMKIVEDMSGHPYEDEAESFRKMFLAMAEDLRIVFIKLADRLHNMRTVNALSLDRQRRLAKETLEIWAPLANRLGVWQVKSELEDLSFRITHPDVYKEIASLLTEDQENRSEEIAQIIREVQKILQEQEIEGEVSGRPKHIYSIYAKMMRKGLPYEKIFDVRAVRVVVKDIPACYSALGVIHMHWRPIPGEFDDYIAVPKDNGYQSLHTAVIYDDGKPLEVQVRTREMDENAEIGIAAHWKYKEGGKLGKYGERINWLRMVMDWRQEVEDARAFLDGMKTDIFQDRVYVFTPRGDIIDLPAHSTPIDFAYHVHTDIGHRCRGAKVNGKLVTLDYQLKTGEQVEILTTKRGGPSRDWLNPNLGMVKTQRARAKIRYWFKRQERANNIAQGKEMLEKELHRLGIVSVNLEQLARQFDFKAVEDMYDAIGCGDMPMGRITNYLMLNEQDEEGQTFASRLANEPARAGEDTMTVLGLKGLLTSMARCCNPVPGDDIVGYITRGRGATIHRKDCPNILRIADRERLVKVSWGEPKNTYPVAVQIKAYDRDGLVKDVSNLVADEGVNMSQVTADVDHDHKLNLAVVNLILEVRDIDQLARVLTRLEALPNVMEVHRMRPG